ncbi:hypothetical protein [Allobaculum sp. Allo2]|nr:hypothetical protein [Allobaculum sp. Allo2]
MIQFDKLSTTRTLSLHARLKKSEAIRKPFCIKPALSLRKGR